MLYNIPKYMHFALPPELVAELAQHENIIGIKDSSGDRELFARLHGGAAAIASPCSPAARRCFAEALRMGADGGILAVALFAPRSRSRSDRRR